MRMKRRSFLASMQRDALITLILIEALCTISLLCYIFAKIFSWNTSIKQNDAIAALLIAVLSLFAYGLFMIVSKIFYRENE